ncbi:MAG: preprotein translocase subunit SecE [Verrucomicrobiota bacterium]|nr:preprotein translocase subunit SecE [Verrucomicrobiota bacterium]
MFKFIAKVRLFLNETVAELKKSSWPSWEELRESTFVVFAASILMGLYITLSDFSVYNFISACTHAVVKLVTS